jgi:hypothetical protein
MKNKLYNWLIAFIFLVLLHPSGVLAAGKATSASMPPKTAEELLVCIRDFLTNPDINGVVFAEKITGMNEANWGPVKIHTSSLKDPKDGQKVYYGENFKQPMSAIPYGISEIRFEEHTYTLIGIDFILHRGVFPKHYQGDPDYLLKITPKLIRKVFGPPDELAIRSLNLECDDLDLYNLFYTYLQGRYALKLTFWAKGDNDLKTRREYDTHTPEQIRQERDRRKLFNNHKNFWAVDIQVIRMK